ncbi:MAG: hypothetical protein HY069_04485 [Chlamydiia bacterium]|nr:hypothetical protein [Chlamydiia bacterium]
MAIQAKISEKSKKVVQEIIKETGESQIAVIEHAVLAYHREWRMHKINAAYSKYRKNEQAWKEERKERSILEQTSEDGFEDA